MDVIAKRQLSCCSLDIMETLVPLFSLHLLMSVFKAVWCVDLDLDQKMTEINDPL